MTDMIDRVAEAMWKADYTTSQIRWTAESTRIRTGYLRRARAALFAVRHAITDEMRKAGLRAMDSGGGPDVILWEMLGAALKEWQRPTPPADGPQSGPRPGCPYGCIDGIIPNVDEDCPIHGQHHPTEPDRPEGECPHGLPILENCYERTCPVHGFVDIHGTPQGKEPSHDD